MTTVNVGVPPSVATSTSSLKVTVTLNVPPSDLSKLSISKSIAVMSARFREVLNSPIATITSS